MEVPNGAFVLNIIMRSSKITIPIKIGIRVVQILYTSNIPSLFGEHVSGFLNPANLLKVLFSGFDEAVFPILSKYNLVIYQRQ